MAKQNRSGLGRGLNSLLGGPSEAAPMKERTKNRDRIVYDEREDVVYENNVRSRVNDGTNSSVTGRFGAVGNPRENVSRETFNQNSASFNPVIPATRSQQSTQRQQMPVQQPQQFNQPVQEPVQQVVQEAVQEEAVKEVISNEVVEQVEEKDSTTQDKPVEGNMIYDVAIESVTPNPDQPRTNFNEDDLKELSNSIKREGLIQPILVREIKDGEYQIIAGERRWQASKLAGLETVPVQIKDVDDEKALELALIENIQRTDLNPIEEAYGYKRLMERNKMTQADIAQAVSKGRSTIANALRLLELPEEAQKLLYEDKITAGHARAILSVPDKEGRITLTNKLADNKLSVRETENLARLMANKPEKGAKKEPTPAIYKSVARTLKNILKTNVKIKSVKGKNKIEIEFADEKDLERIFEIINPE